MAWVAEQANGEQILYEDWVIEAYRHGTLTDPLLLGPLRSRVLPLYQHGWPGQRDRAIAMAANNYMIGSDIDARKGEND